MKKIKLLAVAAALVMIVTAFAVGCKPPESQDMGNLSIGSAKPTETAATPITSGMSGKEMFLAGIANYYTTDYVSTQNFGAVDTTILGGLKVTQIVGSTKVRAGKLDDPDMRMFVDNRSASDIVKIYEESFFTGKDDIVFHNAKKKNLDYKKGTYYVFVKEDKEGNPKWDSAQKFTDLAKYVDDKKNDPTKLWMYDVTDDTVLSDTAVTFEDGVYSFDIECDPITATTEYVKEMLYMLNQNVKTDELVFKKLSFKVQMWENGFIKQIKSTERYGMKILSFIDGEVELNSTLYFSYDQNEKFEDAASDMVISYNIDDYVGKIK